MNDGHLAVAAFDSPIPARVAWTQWCATHRLDDLDAGTSSVLPVVLANLRSDGYTGELADQARLEGITRHWRVRQHVLLGAAG